MQKKRLIKVTLEPSSHKLINKIYTDLFSGE